MSLAEFHGRLQASVASGQFRVDDVTALVPGIADRWAHCTRHWSRNGLTNVPCVVARLDLTITKDFLIHVAGAIATNSEPPQYYPSLTSLIGEASGFEGFNGGADSRWPTCMLVLWDSRASFGKLERRGLSVFIETRPEIVGVHLAGKFVPASGDVQRVGQPATERIELRLNAVPRALSIGLVANGEVLDQIEEMPGSRSADLLTDSAGTTFLSPSDPASTTTRQPDDVRSRLTNGEAPAFESLEHLVSVPEFMPDPAAPLAVLAKEGAGLILYTATPTETNAALAAMTPLDGCAGLGKAFIGDYTYYLGKMGTVNVVLTMSRPGSGLRDGAGPALMDAIAEFRPKGVIAVGFAFGGYTRNLKIADVLVSNRIIPYEIARKQPGGDISRAQQPEAGRLLLNRFRGVIGWQFSRPDGRVCGHSEGPLLSGEKLVDDLDFKTELFMRFPDALGGEMEGAGVYGAAAARGIEWIIVKAVCDWGDGTKNKLYQSVAAASAVSLVRHVLSDPGVLNGLRTPGTAPGSPGHDGTPHHEINLQGTVVTHATVIAGDVHYHDNAAGDDTLAAAEELIANGLLDEAIAKLKGLEVRQWIGLSTAQKYRLRKLQGRALMLKERTTEAAQQFREAFELAPTDPKAQLLRAYADNLEGKSASAHALAQTLKGYEATRDSATALWVRTSPMEVEIEALVPQPWAGLHADVAVAVAGRLLELNRAVEAEQVIRTSVPSDTNPELWECLGVCILTADRIATPEQTLDSTRLEEARDALGKALGLIKGQSLPSRRLGITLNRALIAAALSDRAAEWAALTAAEAIQPDDAMILARKSHWLLQEARYGDAVAALEQLAARGGGVDGGLMLAYALYKRAANGDAARALELVQHVLDAGPAEPDRRRDAAELELEIRRHTEGSAAARSAIDRLRDFLGAFRAGEWSIKLDLEGGDVERAAAEALALYERRADWNLKQREVLGILLLQCARADEAFDVLQTAAPQDRMSESTAALMRAAEVTEKLEYLIRLCDHLIAAGVNQAGVVDAQIAALSRRGDTGKALEVAIEYLRDHENPYIRLRRAMLGHALGQTEFGESDATKLPPPAEGLGVVASHVVDVLRASGNHLEAVRFAYANFRLNRADPDAWRAVIQSFLPIHGDVPLDEPERVEPGSAVRFREGSAVPTWIVIEDNGPDPSHGEHATSHALVQAMLGKQPGERFEMPRGALPPRVFVVEEVKSKYVHLYQHCLTAFEPTFPGASGPMMFEVPEDPERLMEMFRSVLEARTSQVDELFRLYSTNPACSLHMLEARLGGTVYDVMQTIAIAEDVDLKCTFEENAWTEAVVDGVGDGDVVIDGPAISTLLLLDMSAVLGQFSGRLAVAQGTIDELLAHRVAAVGKAGGVLGAEEGRVFFREISIADRDAYLARVDAMLAALQDVGVFVEDQRSSLLPEEWDLWSKFGGVGTAESLHRCVRTGARLWTDDGAIAALAKQKGVGAIWTQLALAWVQRRDGMDERALYDASARLVGWRFVRTNMNANVLLQAAVIAQWSPARWPMREHLRVLENAPWSARQVVMMIGSAIRLWWRDAPNELSAIGLTLAILDRLAARTDVEHLCRALLEVLPVLFSLDVLNLERARGVVRAWLKARA